MRAHTLLISTLIGIGCVSVAAEGHYKAENGFPCSLVRALGLGLRPGFGSAAAAVAGDGSVELIGEGGCPEGTKPYLAAGQWKGPFRLVYEPQFLGLPGTMKLTVTWSGEMSFAAARTQLDDPPPPAKDTSSRRPLYPPTKPGEKPPPGPSRSDRAQPGQFKSDEAQIKAILEYWAEQGRKDE